MNKREQELEFLRLADEPCVHFNEERIHSILMDGISDFMDLLERFYLAWQAGESIVEQPRKQVFTTPGFKGDHRVMPCMINRFENAVIKAVKIIGTNEENRVVPDKICVGKAMLIDEADNFIKATFDVCALSSFRTAAISALAFKHCGMKGSLPKIGIVGGGRIGFYLTAILTEWLKVSSVRLFDVKRQRAEALVGLFPTIGTSVETLDEICTGSSAVFLCTDARDAILSSSNASSISFISSVGADASNLSELDISLLEGRQVVSESRQNVAFGDMARWCEEGRFAEDDVWELRDLVGRDACMEQPVLFISTGTAVQDALVCHFIYELVQEI